MNSDCEGSCGFGWLEKMWGANGLDGFLWCCGLCGSLLGCLGSRLEWCEGVVEGVGAGEVCVCQPGRGQSVKEVCVP